MNPVDDFLKEAGFLDNVKNVLMERVLPVATVGVGLGAGIAGIDAGAKAIQEHFGKQRAYKAMLEANPNLGKMDAGKVQMTYNSLRKMAPSLASDPLLAGSFVRKTLEMSDIPYIDPQTMKTLTDAQKSISQAKRSGGMKDFVMGTAAGAGSGALPDYKALH